MNGPTRKKIYALLSESDGEYCKCRGALAQEMQLVIDHNDNNNSNNASSNMHLLCRRCNYEKNPRRPVDLSECEEENESDSELQASRVKEPLCRRFVFHEINELREVPETELSNSGSEDVETSPVTGER